MQFSIPYATEPKETFWGRPTSRANFCEEDNIISSYIAECINTLTNALYVLYAAEGIARNAHRSNALLHSMPYIGLAGVGLGSALFHMLLGYYSQMADELAMLFTTGVVLHRILTASASRGYTAFVGISLTAFLAVLSYVHCSTNELIMHSMTFGIMIVVIGFHTMRLLQKIKSPLVRRKLSTLARTGAAIFVSGYILWLLDTRFCATLIFMRNYVGMPWSFLIELHGWWHIFTAIGAYIFIVLVEYLTTETMGSDPTGLYAWPTSSLLRLAAAGADNAKGKWE